MATTTTRAKDIPTTATTAASDDYFLIDGATNGTRKCAHNSDAAAHEATQLAAQLKGVRSALADGRRSLRVVCIGDSTADGADNWPYLLAGKVAAAYPEFSVTTSQWDATHGTYYWKNTLSTGADGERYVSISGSGYGKLPNSAYPTPTTKTQQYIFLVDDLDWTGSIKTLVSKFGASGNRALRIATSYSKILFSFSENGTDYVDVSSTANLPAPARMYIRVTFTPDNGSGGYEAKFEYSLTGGTWVQIGSTVTGGYIAKIFNGTSDWFFLQAVDGAKLYFAELRTGADLVSQWPQWIDAMTLTSATFVGAPVVHFQILGYAGGTYSTWYNATRLAAAGIDSATPCVLIALGHNQGTQVGTAHQTEVESLVTALRGKTVGRIVLSTQNPELSQATNWAYHEQRQSELQAIAAKNGCGFYDITPMWRELPGVPADWIASDGMHLHPTAEGYEQWATWLVAGFEP